MLQSHYFKEFIIECGCDEAGRGALAGPVVAAAVILPQNFTHPELNDSKKLNRSQRDSLRKIIEEIALDFAIATISEKVIDEINILNASFLAMNNAVSQLKIKPEFLLIDGNRFINSSSIPHKCIVKGDAKFASIAAASILAKTYRDEWMQKISTEFPHYGWDTNKGYATLGHQKAILEHGLTLYHRKSFHLKRQLRLEF